MMTVCYIRIWCCVTTRKLTAAFVSLLHCEASSLDLQQRQVDIENARMLVAAQYQPSHGSSIGGGGSSIGGGSGSSTGGRGNDNGGDHNDDASSVVSSALDAASLCSEDNDDASEVSLVAGRHQHSGQRRHHHRHRGGSGRGGGSGVAFAEHTAGKHHPESDAGDAESLAERSAASGSDNDHELELPDSPHRHDFNDDDRSSQAAEAHADFEAAMRAISSQLVPSLMPPELLAARNRLASRHRRGARSKREWAEHQRDVRVLRSIKYKDERPARVAHAKAVRDVSVTWLALMVHSRVASGGFWLDKPALRAKIEALRAERETRGAALKIQHRVIAFRNRKLWSAYARFASVMQRHAWRLGLHLRCWRRYRSATLVRKMIQDHKEAPRKMVTSFMHKVRTRIQALDNDTGWLVTTSSW